MKYPIIPKGVAKMYLYQEDMTVCLLFKATKPDGHRLPRFNMQLKPMAFGISFIAPIDQTEEKYDKNLGEVISLGRALKMLNIKKGESAIISENSYRIYFSHPDYTHLK